VTPEENIMRTSGFAELVGLRISQLRGCGLDVYAHAQAARQAGETEERLITIAVWWDSPFFTDAERAVLAAAESNHRPQ
jgi:AhpD family alkylhydroperoxidase